MNKELNLKACANIIISFTPEDIQFISTKFEIKTKQDILDAIDKMITAYMEL